MSDDNEHRKIVSAIRAPHERDFDRDVCAECGEAWPCDVERLAFIADWYMDEGPVTHLSAVISKEGLDELIATTTPKVNHDPDYSRCSHCAFTYGANALRDAILAKGGQE